MIPNTSTTIAWLYHNTTALPPGDPAWCWLGFDAFSSMATPYHHVRTRETNSNGAPGNEAGVPMLSGMAPIPRQWDLVHAGWGTHLSLLYAIQTPYHCFRYSIGMWAGGGRIPSDLEGDGTRVISGSMDHAHG